MAKATPLIVSFNGGEVSPKIDARSDITKYQSSCKTLENFIPLVEGGATRTPGTNFVIETKDSTKESRSSMSISNICTLSSRKRVFSRHENQPMPARFVILFSKILVCRNNIKALKR